MNSQEVENQNQHSLNKRHCVTWKWGWVWVVGDEKDEDRTGRAESYTELGAAALLFEYIS